MNEKAYTVKEAAKLLGYSTNTIYGYLKSKEIKSVRVGRGKIRIPARELEKFVPETSEVAVKATYIPEASLVLPPPRPGRSLADLAGETPWHIIKLWLAERVGLPRLFDWFVALSSIILGLSMFLYNRQLDYLIAGNLSDWFLPIRLTLIIAGFGLILADMIQEEFTIYENLNNLFRIILMVVYAWLAYIQMRMGDMDGLIINGLFAFTILIESIFNVYSSTAYMIYVEGIVIGTVLAFRYFPATSGLSSISAQIYRFIDGYSWILNGIALLIILALFWGYFTSRRSLKIMLGLSGVLLVFLSAHYASESYWSRSFFVLIAAMIGMILPFWEEFKVKCEYDRTLVFRMFGTIIMAFSLAVVLIGIVQSILMRSTMTNLIEKVDYGKIITDETVTGSFSALEGLSENELFQDALERKDEDDLVSFSSALFKNFINFNNITVTDVSGQVIAIYPFIGTETKLNFARQNFFNEVVGGKQNYFSTQLEPYQYDSANSVIVGVPVIGSDGTVIGGVFASYNLAVLNDKLQEIAVESEGQYFGVLDADGIWVINKNVELVNKKVLETDIAYLAWLNRRGVVVGYNGLGRYSIVTLSRANEVDWTSMVAQPVFSALDISKSGLTTVMFLLFITAGIVAYSYVFARRGEGGETI